MNGRAQGFLKPRPRTDLLSLLLCFIGQSKSQGKPRWRRWRHRPHFLMRGAEKLRCTDTERKWPGPLLPERFNFFQFYIVPGNLVIIYAPTILMIANSSIPAYFSLCSELQEAGSLETICKPRFSCRMAQIWFCQ